MLVSRVFSFFMYLGLCSFCFSFALYESACFSFGQWLRTRARRSRRERKPSKSSGKLKEGKKSGSDFLILTFSFISISKLKVLSCSL